MDYLIDTHVLLWFINGENLNSNIVSRLQDPVNRVFISIASIWEVAIKYSAGKLTMNITFEDLKIFLIQNNIQVLAVEFEHIQQLLKLPSIHNDPFDRIIIAQSIHESLPVITKDDKFALYPVTALWE